MEPALGFVLATAHAKLRDYDPPIVLASPRRTFQKQVFLEGLEDLTWPLRNQSLGEL